MNRMTIFRLPLPAALALILAACSSPDVEYDYPDDTAEKYERTGGSLLGTEGFIIGGVANGLCDVVINSAVAGTFNAHAASTFTILTESVTVETDGLSTNGSTNSGDAEKIYISFTIIVIVCDHEGNLVPSSVFLPSPDQNLTISTGANDSLCGTPGARYEDLTSGMHFSKISIPTP